MPCRRSPAGSACASCWAPGSAATPPPTQPSCERALELARDYRDVVQLLVVGNEVLLRRELPPAGAGRPAGAGPARVAGAGGLCRCLGILAAPCAGTARACRCGRRPYPAVLGGRAGRHRPGGRPCVRRWPRSCVRPSAPRRCTSPKPAGRRRAASAARRCPGRLEQARFVRELLARQAGEPLAFNLIEGFDQPWKRDLEGAMGGAWGLFDAEGGPARTARRGRWCPIRSWLWLPAAALGGAGRLAGGVVAARPARCGHAGDRRWPWAAG